MKHRWLKNWKTWYRSSPSTYVDHFDHSGSWLCASRKSSFLCGKNGRNRNQRSPEENFRELMNYDFTPRRWEKTASTRWQITKQSGKLYWITFLGFHQQLDKAEKIRKRGVCVREPDGSDQHSPTARPVVANGIRTASTGGIPLAVLASALPPKERCKTTINPVPENEVLNVLKAKTLKPTRCAQNVVAWKCGTAMDMLSHRSET